MSLFKKPAFAPVTEVWIETGTYLGDGVQAALDHGYPCCISIERNGPIYESSARRFRDDDRVEILFGASPDILPRIVDAHRTTTFWLDGHYSGQEGERDKRYGECPLIPELDIITEVKWQVPPIILIDDAFMFLDWKDDPGHAYLQRTYRREEWPLLPVIQRRFPRYKIEVYPTQDGTDPVNPRGMLVMARV